MANEQFRHIFLPNPPAVNNFTSTSSFGAAKRIQDRDRSAHSGYLINRLNLAWQESENERAVVHAAREGVYIEFKSDPGAELVTKSLDDMQSKKVRLLNVRTEQEGEEAVTYATVYVANEMKNYFLQKIQKYAQEDSSPGKPKNLALITSIADIRKALLIESFWQDEKSLIPSDEKAWCEVWLSKDTNEAIERFENLLRQEGIESANGLIRFPERTIKLILANKIQLERLTTLSDDIAEYRRAKETAAFWVSMENEEQAQWVKDILQRCNIEPDSGVSICVLDTGINNGHPLLSIVLKAEDCHAVESEWGAHDHKGHGTLMAGLAAYGDLRQSLAGKLAIRLQHRLESVKILPPPPNGNKRELWGYVTAQAVSRAEIKAPDRKRVVCMAVSADDKRDQGRPSSWSGRMDQLSSGADDDNKRLFIVSAGNADPATASKYPDAQQTDSVHDPAQAWNILTVGAFTELDQIKDKSYAGFMPVAPSGGLSPFSTTSLTWDNNKWPIKPEIVMEGGNLAHDGEGLCEGIDDLSVLSTHHDPAKQHFSTFNMTSAATAQAAWFAAQIHNIYSDIWPETIRALMVHSAEWTNRLKEQFLGPRPTKTDYARLLRICGYGVPNLSHALYSATNNLTLIAQNELQPFDKQGSLYKMREMHLYDLPWPKEVLLDLPPAVKVQMRVTLSYFIEPGPGEIGWKDRYRYASHALRFDVKSPSETQDLFLKRINAAAREEDEGNPGTQSASGHWVIGSNGRDKGSIHSDIWEGTAAELAESGIIAVYPVIGWWRERAYLNKWNKKARYSLVVSITTQEEQVDIYTPVANKVGITVTIAVAT